MPEGGADSPRYTPFDGSGPSFAIGLKPLAIANWIEPDAHFAAHLAEKDRIRAQAPQASFQAEPEMQAAQAEVLDLLWAHLPAHHPDVYQSRGGSLILRPNGEEVTRGSHPEAPLRTAARLVQEDLCLMLRDARGWRLGAASLCFPSHWSLLDKFGRTLDEIHKPVPGYAGEMASRVARIFDHLKAEAPVWRLNWSLHDEARLYQPGPSDHPRFGGLSGEGIWARAYLRVERQTLRRLPGSGAVLFTIKTYMDPLSRLRQDAGLVSALVAALEGYDDAQLAYKGLTQAGPRLLEALQAG